MADLTAILADPPLTVDELAELKQVTDIVRLRAFRLMLRHKTIFKDGDWTGAIVFNFSTRDKSVKPVLTMSPT